MENYRHHVGSDLLNPHVTRILLCWAFWRQLEEPKRWFAPEHQRFLFLWFLVWLFSQPGWHRACARQNASTGSGRVMWFISSAAGETALPGARLSARHPMKTKQRRRLPPEVPEFGRQFNTRPTVQSYRSGGIIGISGMAAQANCRRPHTSPPVRQAWMRCRHCHFAIEVNVGCEGCRYC